MAKFSNLKGQQAEFTIKICPETLRKSKKKCSKEDNKRMDEILRTFCALLNHGDGGKLKLSYDEQAQDGDIKECNRRIEQTIKHVFQLDPDCKQNSGESIITVKSYDNLATLNCHLYSRSETQVTKVFSGQLISTIQEMRQREKTSETERVAFGSHCQNFTIGEDSGLRESRTVELKLLKDGPKLADRITTPNNKLHCYVSAFGSKFGGHIYYGIDDDGKVIGQTIAEGDKHRIETRVKKVMEKMVCLSHSANNALNWKIYFVQVNDEEESEITSNQTSVIVISVESCRDVLFSECPESYHVVQGKVEKMSLEDYWAKLNLLLDPTGTTQSQSVPSNVPPIQWSSRENQELYRKLTTTLVWHRNNNQMEQFKQAKTEIIESLKRSNSVADLVILSEEFMVACKNGGLREAGLILEQFETLLKDNRQDCTILEVIFLYSKSRLERAKGNYNESYEYASCGLQKMEGIPVEFITVRFYLHAATLATILSSNERDSSARVQPPQAKTEGAQVSDHTNFVDETTSKCLQLASRDIVREQYFDERVVDDLQQKVRIYRAEAHLGCSMTGDTLSDHRSKTNEDDGLRNAAEELLEVHKMNIMGHVPTLFRKCQFLLAQSDLSYRRHICSKKPCSDSEHFLEASDLAKQALELAQDHNFPDLINYAKRRLQSMDEN